MTLYSGILFWLFSVPIVERVLLPLAFTYKNYYHAILGNTDRFHSNVIQNYNLNEDITFFENSSTAGNK